MEQYSYFFLKEISLDPAAAEKYLKSPESFTILSHIREALSAVEPFEAAVLENALRGLAERLQKKAGELIHPLRVAVTGRSVSPGIFETLVALGKPLALERLNQTIKQRGV